MTAGDGLDMEATFSSYRDHVVRSAPDALPLALRTWARLDPARWPLEWHLPLWLGETLGLKRRISQQLVTSNVLGLASVRLADDLVDGDLLAEDISRARDLSRVLYEAAVRPYRGLFPAESVFWRRLDGWMAAWREATEPIPAGSAIPPGYLARRGAPLMISALAVCLLADRESAFERIDECLDHALTAMVLFDHACDWREDLAADRWNAFVAASSKRGEEADVLEAMMTGRSVAPYFEHVDTELDRAVALADGAGVERLASQLRQLRTTFAAEARRLDRRYGELGAAAVRLIFEAA